MTASDFLFLCINTINRRRRSSCKRRAHVKGEIDYSQCTVRAFPPQLILQKLWFLYGHRSHRITESQN